MQLALDFRLMEALRVIREGRGDCDHAKQYLAGAANDASIDAIPHDDSDGPRDDGRRKDGAPL